MAATHTTNLNLNKPARTDFVSVVSDINDNMDILDGAIGAVPQGETVQGQIDGVNSKIGTVPSGKTVQGQLNEKAPINEPNFTGNVGLNRYDTPGYASIAMGDNPTASGDWSVSLGYMNEATGDGSFAKNIGTWAEGYGSDTSGIGTIAKHKAQHVFGQYNESTYEDESDDPTDPGTYIEMVGNGTSSNSSNARALDWNGNERLAGDVYVNCNDDSTGGTALGAEVAGVKSSIGAVPSGKTVEGQISGIESNIGTVPTGHTVMGDISDVKSAIALQEETIPDTTQTITFDQSGNVVSIVHTDGNENVVRSDVFTFGTNIITEVRTLASGESLTIVTNTETLVTTVTYADAA